MTRCCARLALILLLAACESFPELDAADARLDATRGYPAIAPIDAVIASAQAGPPATTATDIAAVQARAAGLQARGAALGGPVTDAETRARLIAATGKGTGVGTGPGLDGGSGG